MEPRIIAALALMGGSASVAGIYAAVAWRRAKAQRLRRRGIKRPNGKSNRRSV